MGVNELKEKFLRANVLNGESFKLLQEYVNGMLALHGGSIGFEVKSYDQCEEDGEEYYDQFPIVIDVDCNHDTFQVAVTNVWITENGRLRVDGEEQAEWGNNWHKGLYTRDNYEVYHEIAFFIDEIIERRKTQEWLKVGTKCKWNDPAINDYEESEREEAANRVFTIEGINGDIILICDGATEAEVPISELDPLF